METKVCEYSGKEFQTVVKKRRFCSISCARKFSGAKEYPQRLQLCLKKMSRCGTKREFMRQYPLLYQFCRYHKVKQYYDLPLGKRNRKKYSDEEVRQAARRYKYKEDFHKQDSALYFCALRRGLMKDFHWLRSKPNLYDSINYIYRYFFMEQNAVYIGRTINIEKRDRDHRRDRGEKSSIVFRYAKANGKEIPQLEVLEQGLSGEESQVAEDRYVRLYRGKGFKILNSGATGLGTGSMGKKRYFTRVKVIEESHKYETLAEFRENSRPYYEAACKYGWIHDHEFDFLQRKIRNSKTLTEDYCRVIARRYKSRKELIKGDIGVYDKMLHMGWIDKCEWLKSAHAGYHKLTHDYCMQIARQYKSLTLMQKERYTIVKKLYKTGWIKECTWLPQFNKKKIEQYTLEGGKIAEFNSLQEAAKAIQTNGHHADSVIGEVCRGKKKTAYGYKWRYA